MEENISLKSYNTFGVEAFAHYFSEVSTTEELLKIIADFNKLREKHAEHLPLLILGGGSNILFTKDFEGLVIKLSVKGIEEKILDENNVLVTAKSGENWHQFVMSCLNKNYGGLENLSLIPGNVGTSPMQNIGAYGVEIKDVFQSCKVLNLETLDIEVFDAEQCKFGYRESVFKKEAKGKYLILEVTFRLTRRNHKIHTEYGAIKSELDVLGIRNPTICDIASAVISIRKSKLPDPKLIGNAGSFFKNPTIPKNLFIGLKNKFDDIPGYEAGPQVKVPAGWLIEQTGWKGRQIGNVATHKMQALVIINATGDATGKEIFDFSQLIINSVQDKFGIDLEREVNII